MALPFDIFTRIWRPKRNASRSLIEAASWARQTGPAWGVGNATVSQSLWAVRAKSQAAYANDPWYRNGIDALVTGTIGAGIVPASMVPDTPTRAVIGKAWGRWIVQADADGRTDFPGLQALVERSRAVDGESLVLMLNTPSGLRLRVLPAAALDNAVSRMLPSGGRITEGVEYDTFGIRVAYWLRENIGEIPFVSVAAPIRVPAEDVCHVFKATFAGQVRGMPEGTSVLVALNELDQLQDALLVGSKVAAMHAGFLIDQNGSGASPYTDGVTTGTVLEGGLEPGTMKILPAGFDVKFSTPQQSTSGIEQIKLGLRSVAAGLGVPEYLLTGDLSQANYSSTRAALVEFRARIEQTQFGIHIPQMLRPVWRRWLTLEILSGRIEAPGFESDPESYLSVEWYPPAQPVIDPLKDAEGEAELIAAGLKSRRQAVAERGYNIETLDTEIAADKAREKALGLSFDTQTAPVVGVPAIGAK